MRIPNSSAPYRPCLTPVKKKVKACCLTGLVTCEAQVWLLQLSGQYCMHSVATNKGQHQSEVVSCSWAGPSGADSAWDNISRPQEEASEPLLATSKRSGKASWAVTIATLLSLQLGWGLWLMPSDYARCSSLLAAVSQCCAYKSTRVYCGRTGSCISWDLGCYDSSVSPCDGSKLSSICHFLSVLPSVKIGTSWYICAG